MYSGIVAFLASDRLGQKISEHPVLLNKLRVESVHDYGNVRLITMHSGDSHYVFDTLDEIIEKVWTA